MTTRIADVGAEDIARLSARLPRAFALTTRERLLRGFGVGGAGALFLWLLVAFEITPARLWNGLSGLGILVAQMMPPSHDGYLSELVSALFETLAMAFLGTFLAAIAAAPLGFLGARNVIPNWVFHFSLRRLFDGVRGVDQLIWALVFVRAVGLGPLAGILAIFIADTAVLGKLYAEAIENADERQTEGVRATGANRLLVVRFGMLPQIIPVMLSQALYFFESNTRSATMLGIVGAGGIGLQLTERIRVREWDQVAFIILMILVTVALIDWLSRHIRTRVIGRTGDETLPH